MPSVTCPTCGEKGKIPANLVGARIKCKKCGVAFTVAPPAGKAATAGAAAHAGPTAVAESHEGIEVEGLEASAWSLAGETHTAVRDEAAPEPTRSTEASPAFVAAAPSPGGTREYKVLTSKDKIFDNRFDLNRLEEVVNQFARQGWIVKAMAVPHVKGFSGAPEETIVVLLER